MDRPRGSGRFRKAKNRPNVKVNIDCHYGSRGLVEETSIGKCTTDLFLHVCIARSAFVFLRCVRELLFIEFIGLCRSLSCFEQSQSLEFLTDGFISYLINTPHLD